MTQLTDLIRRIQGAVGVAVDGVFGPATANAVLQRLNIASPVPAVTPSGQAGRMKVSSKGIDLLHHFEGLRLDAYPDPGTGGKPWTIGWGATTDERGVPIQPGAKWTRERADARFLQHIAAFEADVNGLIGTAPTTQGQFDAMVSFAYNVGSDVDQDLTAEGLGDSTLMKKHLRGDYAGAAAEFAKWNKSAGAVMKGLTRRRAAEAALYRGDG